MTNENELLLCWISGLLLDRWWSLLGASLSCVVGGMLSERVYACPYGLRMHKSCPECGVHALCLVWKGLVWSNQWDKLTYVKPKNAWRHRQGSASMKRFTGLSLLFQPRSSLRRCLCFSSAFSVLYTTHCTVHMSVAWLHASVGTCNVSVSHECDGHGRSVGRCMWSRRLL